MNLTLVLNVLMFTCTIMFLETFCYFLVTKVNLFCVVHYWRKASKDSFNTLNLLAVIF